MSFSDIGTTGNTPSTIRPAQRTSISSAINTPAGSSSGGGGDTSDLAESLKAFQKDLTFLNNRITEMKRRMNSATEKTELDKRLKNLQAFEKRIDAQMNDKLQRLENLPRAESAQRRFAIIKLQKDFDRVRPIVQTMVRESGQLQVGKHDASVSGNAAAGNRNKSAGGTASGQQANREPQLTQMMVGRDVDDLIMEEREQDIMRLNRDVALVNEMFKDMAEIIEKQGELVEEIHESTEASRARAEGGLEEVKKAAEYQPVCVIS